MRRKEELIELRNSYNQLSKIAEGLAFRVVKLNKIIAKQKIKIKELKHG